MDLMRNWITPLIQAELRSAVESLKATKDAMSKPANVSFDDQGQLSIHPNEGRPKAHSVQILCVGTLSCDYCDSTKDLSSSMGNMNLLGMSV
jgi:hypothetical protein